MPFIDLSKTSSEENVDAQPAPVPAPQVAPVAVPTPITPAAVTTEDDAPTSQPPAAPVQVQFNADGTRELSGPSFEAAAAVIPPEAPVQTQITEPVVGSLPIRPSVATPLPDQPIENLAVSAPEMVAQTMPTSPLEAPADIQEPAPQQANIQDILHPDLPELPPENQLEALEREVSAMQTPVLGSAIEANSDLKGQEYNLDDLLTQTVELGASDLHLTSGYRAMARVDGRLQIIRSQMLTHESIKAMITPIAAKYPEVDLDRDLDLDLAYQLPEGTRFRVNIGYQQQSMTATFRLIPSVIKTPQELHLPALVTQFTKYKQGLVLVTGPTGSGKSTTLAALVNEINKTEAKHIITIEDPIEYAYPKGSSLVDQRNVGVDTSSWPMALRAALRQDPDVVLIGEMRDIETMEAALQVAETGHLVFSTLHTNTAAQTIDRVIDAFPKGKQEQVRTQLATVLMAVISQRLIPIAGGGRRIAVEVMVVTPAIRNAIRENKVFQIDNMIQTGAEYGMITLEKSLAQLVRDGLISVEMAQLQANKPEDILSILGRS